MSKRLSKSVTQRNCRHGVLALGLPGLVFLAGMLLQACVTVEDKVFTADTSDANAIQTRVNIALRYLQQDNPEQAISNLQMALQIDPKSPRVHEVLGIAFQQAGEFELAEDHYRRALRYDPNYSRGRNNYATFLMTLDRYDDACKELKKVVNDVYYDRRSFAFFNLGQCALKIGNLEEAEESFKRSLRMDRTLTASRLELADVYYKQGNYSEAQTYLDAYRAEVDKAGPRALLLSIRLAEQFKDQDAVASYKMALKSMYPRSKEYLELVNPEAKDE